MSDMFEPFVPESEPEPKPPIWAVWAIYLTVFSTAVGGLIALSILLNAVFGVRELDDTVGARPSEVLADLDESAGIPTAITPPTSDPTLTSTPVAPTGSYNLILAGNDYRPGRAPACELCYLKYTDTFVYINIVLDHPSRVTMVSLPRELYLHVDGIYPDSRVNQLYARGGIDWITLWSESVLGVEIDGVAIIEMDVFERIVDDLDGIDIIAPETFEDKCGDSFYAYEEGEEYHLDGFNALCYARMRMYNPRGYFARQERHMDILQSIFQSAIDEFSEDPIVTSVKMVSLYYEEIESTMPPELIAKIISDVVLVYYLGEDLPEIRMFSIDASRLELYPRANEDSPYLYKPTFVIRDWLQCILQAEASDC